MAIFFHPNITNETIQDRNKYFSTSPFIHMKAAHNNNILVHYDRITIHDFLECFSLSFYLFFFCKLNLHPLENYQVLFDEAIDLIFQLVRE
jgi:hypothetical protein